MPRCWDRRVMKYPGRRTFILPLYVSLRLCVYAASGPVVSVVEAETELARRIDHALRRNPIVLSAQRRCEESQAGVEQTDAFFDPRLLAALGQSDRFIGPMAGFRDTGLHGDSVGGRVGVEIPARPGAYVSAGIGERYLLYPDAYDDGLYQTHAGIQVWVPLARDRGLSTWRARRSGAASVGLAATEALTDVKQRLRRDVAKAYVAVLVAQADSRAYEKAVARTEALLSDAEELVRLQVVPAYQLYPARADGALRREELVSARSACRDKLIALGALLGETEPSAIEAGEGTLSAWALDASDAPSGLLDEACEARASYRLIRAHVLEAEALERLAADAVRPDVGLVLEASWQGESPDDLWATDTIESEENAGTQASLIWAQSFDRAAERAALRARRAAVEALRETLAGERLRIAAERGAASEAFVSARESLGLLAGAVADAGRTLTAEEDRFHLGEGRSQNVLDAQKALTNNEILLNNRAAAVLYAWFDWQYANGMDEPVKGRGEAGAR